MTLFRFSVHTPRRTLLSLLLVLAFVFDTTGQVRRRIEISRFVQPSRVATAVSRGFFSRAFRFAGGVVPRGSAEFLSPGLTKLPAAQLRLVILDKAKLRNGRPDYDAIGIRWRGKDYQLSAQDDMIYPLMKFIQRGSFIAFTIPVVAFDKEYFRQNSLVEMGVGYVAKEFKSPSHVEFLEEIDLETETEEIAEPRIEARIKSEVGKGDGRFSEEGTYVNADFHVKYQVFLNNTMGKNVADVGGLPLRYSWSLTNGRTLNIDYVNVFTFPKTEGDLQDRAVIFFQTAAILRQFFQDNRQEFNRFMREVGAVLERR